jgi:type I restriction enzyme M protein
MKMRVKDETAIDPWLLFAALNSPIVKRQIRAKRFTRDIIDGLGNRLSEVRVPLPLDPSLRERVAKEVQLSVQRRAELREATRLLTLEVEGSGAAEDLSMLEEVT